jgi:electron transport complex protein RnfB
MTEKADNSGLTRRDLLRLGAGGAIVLGLGATGGLLARHAAGDDTVWQIDPDKCIGCGNCATYCVLSPSAVKCVHAFKVCGYCELCFGYFNPKTKDQTTGAENLLCPVDALRRKHVEGPYYQYTIDEPTCIGCGKCVKGCTTFGNGSLFLQVRHDRCVNCNQCAIAAACPSSAFVRIRASELDAWLRQKGRRA